MTDQSRPPFPLGVLRDLVRKLRLPGLGGRPRPQPVEPVEPKQPVVAPTDDELSAEIRRAQVAVIRKAFDGDVATGPPEGTLAPRDDAEAAYLFRPGHALVREEYLERVARFFDERGESFRGGLERVEEPTRGLALVRLPSRADGEDDVLATLEELERTDDELGKGAVTPDHVLFVTAYGRFCPAIEPEVPRQKTPLPAVADEEGAGKGVRVSVVDTGLWEPAVTSATTPWMSGVLADPTDVETINPAAIHPYGGHGTFVAGVVRCLAPAARVEVEGALPHGGAVYESEICRQLDEALNEPDHPQLISISAGSHTRRNFAMLSFEMLAAAHGLDDGEETLIVAAAGNDGSDQMFWPAAFPWVVSVGSVDPAGGVSDYSNVGPWVDAYARGRDVVNAFPVGSYTCYEPPNAGQLRQFNGLAAWSGTSFSTPLVTGLIAARMSASGENARQAWGSVLGGAANSVDPRGGNIKTVGPLS